MPQFLDCSFTESNANSDDKDEIGDSQSNENATEAIQEPEISSNYEKPYDAMRCEPLLTDVLVELYEGERDEQRFFHGYGTACFQGGNIYKGDFERGLMHGKGKFVWQDRTIYEGDFVHNQLNGTGMYIWPDDSVYQGEVTNGLRHGHGIYKCTLPPCTYTGMWKEGKRHGQGLLKYDQHGTSYYEGEWFENQREGKGTRRYASGNVYYGNWKNNIRHGEGTMKWFTSNEEYSGQWLNGVQQGFGEHTWFQKRIKGSQYPVRNRYVGNFVNGKRDGHGIFHYASGAKYEGDWLNNMKHGTGMFVFKNGMIFKGTFEKDRMLEYPDINPLRMTTPDISFAGLPVQRPSTPAFSELSIDWSNKLELNITVLFENRNINVDERQLELHEVNNIMLQHISQLKKIYSYYSALGIEKSLDNTSAMSRMQFCRFIKDSHIHHVGSSVPEILRQVATDGKDAYYPWEYILIRDFLTALVFIASHLFAENADHSHKLLPWCLSKLITAYILPHSFCIGGVVYSKPSVTIELNQYLDKTYCIYQYWSSQFERSKPNGLCVNMRTMLLMLKEYNIIGDDLSAKDFINICSHDDPGVLQDDFINLDIEISFYEVFETLVQCAELHVTEMMLKENPVRSSNEVVLTEPCSTAKSQLASTSAGCFDSPVIESRLSSTHSLLNTREERPKADGKEQHSNSVTITMDTPTKDVDIPSLNVTASSSGELKKLPIDDDSEQKQPDETIPVELVPQDITISLTEVQGDGEEGRDVVKEDDYYQEPFNVWCAKMNVFFKNVFFPAAQRYELLNEIALEKLK